MNGPGQVHPPDRVERVVARARRRRWWCRSELDAGQLGRGLLGAARLLRRGRRSRPPGSRRCPRRLPVKPGGILKLRSPRNWSPSSRSSFSVKALKSPASGFEVPATRRGLKGRTWPGHGLPFGPGGDRHERRRVLGGEARVPGHEVRVGRVERALGRRRHQAAVGGEEVQVERLRTAPAAGRSIVIVSCPVSGSGWTSATSFAWMPKPSKIMNTRYWLPGCGSPM